MASYHEVAERWRDRQLGHTDKAPFSNGSNWRMFERNGVIFSYGSHFELGRLLRDRGKPHCWLLNGDRFSNTTTGHQGHVRGVCQRTSIPVLIIPHEALAAGGVELDSIRLLHAEPDRWETTHHPVPGTFPSPPQWFPEIEEVNYNNGRVQKGALYGKQEVISLRRVAYGEDVLEEASVSYTYLPKGRKHPVSVECLGDGEWEWTTSRHWLGASVFTAKARGEKRRSRWISAFDENERHQLYYLARLPHTSRATTYKQALEDLAPRAVHAALAQGREVKRQGDMFAIPVSSSTRELKRRSLRVEKRLGVHGTDHVCTEVIVCKRGVTYARGTMRHQPEDRNPDHAMLKLGKEWHLIVRNTVPAQRRRANAFV